MKKILLIVTAFVFSLAVLAQGNSQGKGKDKQKGKPEQVGSNKEKEEKDRKDKSDHEKKVWDGTYTKEGDGPKPSKNQPAKVRSSFQRDYPNASGISWSKYRGDWTATFRNGAWMSTAVYHANGERRDTRTSVTKNEMPRIVLDSIFKKRPDTRLEDVIKVQVPNVVKDIFRIKDIIQGKPSYFYYNSDGVAVKYDY
jgi:uncharacterized protein YxeA